MDFSLHALEYDRFKDLLGRYLATDAARARLRDLSPSLDESWLEAEHAITAEAMSYLRENRVAFNDISLLPDAFNKLSSAGSTLEIPEIEAVQTFLNQIESLRIRWKEERERFPLLFQSANGFPDLRELSRLLGKAIRNGEIDERYSPELARIRRVLNATRARLTDKLESMVKSPAHSGQLQDQVITLRNGRFVIPVRTEQKRAFDGIVHGTSSSGATVFMEPLAVLDLNNDLVRLQEEERSEIARILAELTSLIQASAGPIDHSRSLAAYLEMVFAKGRFGRDFDCGRPTFSKNGLLSLIKARHPLLEDNLRRERAVVSPVSLDMDFTRRVLVISGPNAGGKTVVLKTVGLLALMAQSGLPVPADEAVLPIFDTVLADIGDQQSIANHLSTFSAHVLSIKSMIESATSQSLILLDEIGGSTEPGEGAALARAVLDKFLAIGSRTVVTTHYNRLKFYAETTPGVTNAAMEFNEITLEPTYRLIHGLSGASSGLKIAERLKLPLDVLQSAHSFVDSADAEATHYVEELRRRLTDLVGQKSQLEKERQDFDIWKRQEFNELAAQHKEEITRVEKRLDKIVQELSARALKEFESAKSDSAKRFEKKLDVARAQAAGDLRRELEKALQVSTPKSNPTVSPNKALPEDIREGTQVRVISLGVTGSVISVKGGEVEVQAGNIKLRRPVDDLEILAKAPINLPPGVHIQMSSKTLEKNEINVVGCKVDEALDLADKFLDDAFLAQMRQVRIVHGSGTGALRQALSEFLQSHPHVSHVEFARQSEGGRGVTLVTLKD